MPWIESFGTDPELAKHLGGKEGERFIRWFNKSFFGEIARNEPAPGYMAPPLDGVWATAPYLHNGSVPTIEALLNSPSRPHYWLFPEAPTDFARERLERRWHSPVKPHPVPHAGLPTSSRRRT